LKRVAQLSRTKSLLRIGRLAYAILDGTLIPIDRVADQRPYYSGKHKRHGVNVQVIADCKGRLIWASSALPGAVHDLTAARTHGLIDALSSVNVMTFADKAYQGAGGTVRTPFKRRPHRPRLSRRQKTVNRHHAKIRAVGERAVATLKGWKVLNKLRCCPRRAPRSSRPSSPYTTSRRAETHDEKGSMIFGRVAVTFTQQVPSVTGTSDPQQVPFSLIKRHFLLSVHSLDSFQ
jgi:hypothetical protein